MPSVLIIDDDLLVRQGLRSLLDQEYRGVLFGEARGAEEALGEVARRTWDLIILDITYPSVPGKDGFHLLDEIRKRQKSVRESGRNVNLILLICRQKHAGPFPKYGEPKRISTTTSSASPSTTRHNFD